MVAPLTLLIRDELIEVGDEGTQNRQLSVSDRRVVPLRADNVVAVLREPGKGEALEADGVELARQTPEQLQLVEDRGKLAIDAVMVRRIEDFHVEAGGDGAEGLHGSGRSRRATGKAACPFTEARNFTPKILCFIFIIRGGYWCFLKETT